MKMSDEREAQRGSACFAAEEGCKGKGEAGYPRGILQLHDAPDTLFYRGTLPENAPAVAIVGARMPSAYGLMAARELAGALAARGYWIVSGMAQGIDAAAHEGCLDAGGCTVAVLGCGLDVCYPAKNRRLYEQIPGHGCLLSEYPYGRKPLPGQFPARNRLISALADKVVVIEARRKSGSLITADFALEQGKDVYALPGRITDAMSEGCNRLIAQGAGILCSLEEFLRDLGEEEYGRAQSPGAGRLHTEERENFSLEKDRALVYSCFDFYPKGIQQVQNESGLELQSLLAALMDLCDMGLIQETFKNQYVRRK